MLQWDNMVPILLRPCDYHLLQDSDALDSHATSELVDGEVRVGN